MIRQRASALIFVWSWMAWALNTPTTWRFSKCFPQRSTFYTHRSDDNLLRQFIVLLQYEQAGMIHYPRPRRELYTLCPQFPHFVRLARRVLARE